MTQEATQQILIVEDDEAIATGLGLNLKLAHYQATICYDGEDASATLQKADFDLILLDITLPRKNGLDLLRELRDAGDHTPVIVLSAREGEYDKVAALRLGADDYVTKPFRLAELMARVDAVLRRSRLRGDAVRVAERAPPSVITFGDVTVQLDTRSVVRREASVKLTHLEFELLAFFLDHPDRVFTREELLKRVWGVSHSGSRRTVDNFVAQLRSKLEGDPEDPRHFITVRGSGYRFES